MYKARPVEAARTNPSDGSVRRLLALSILSMAVCATCLVGTSWAWFTATATVGVEDIHSWKTDTAGQQASLLSLEDEAADSAAAAPDAAPVDEEAAKARQQLLESRLAPDAQVAALLDGQVRQVAVKDLQVDDSLLAWDLESGQPVAAPVLFVDADPEAECEVTTLSFSDGTQVRTVGGQAFWDIEAGEFVVLDAQAEEDGLVGRAFNKRVAVEGIAAVAEDGSLPFAENAGSWESVTLTGVKITTERMATACPATYGNLCWFVDGMLTAPASLAPALNAFDVDAEAMVYSPAFAQANAPGYLSFDDFAAMFGASQQAFDALDAKRMGAAMDKGLMTQEDLQALVARYDGFLKDKTVEPWAPDQSERY